MRRGGLARGEVAGEEALVDEHRALRGHALVVPAEGAEPGRARRVGGHGHLLAAVAEGAEQVRGQERRARVRGLVAEHAVELGGMAARLVDLERRLGGVEDHRHRPRRAQGGASAARPPPRRSARRCREGRTPRSASQPAQTWWRPKLFGKLRVCTSSSLVAVASRPPPDSMMVWSSARPLAAREVAVLAHELERALADPDLGEVRHGLVGSHAARRPCRRARPRRGRAPPASGTRRSVRVPARGAPAMRLTRDDAFAIWTAWRAVSSTLAASEIVDAGESPGPVDDHADADALVLEQLHRSDHAVLDGEPLHGSIDHPAIGIRGAGGGGRIECSLAELTHEGGVYGPSCRRTSRPSRRSFRRCSTTPRCRSQGRGRSAPRRAGSWSTC